MEGDEDAVLDDEERSRAASVELSGGMTPVRDAEAEDEPVEAAPLRRSSRVQEKADREAEEEGTAPLFHGPPVMTGPLSMLGGLFSRKRKRVVVDDEDDA